MLLHIFKQNVKRLLRGAGYEVVRVRGDRPMHGPLLHFRNFLSLYFKHVSQDFFFINVGANDGKIKDPIYEFVQRYRLSGIAIEPQQDVYKRLVQNYKNIPTVACANVALSTHDGVQTLYTVKDSYKTDENFFSVTGIASFDKDVLRKTLSPKVPPKSMVDSFIDETEVECLTFASLVRRYNVHKIDLLQIDCEGYDLEILKMFDFDRYHPSLVNYESKHLSPTEKQEGEDLLRSKGYEVFTHGSDTCGFT